MANDSTAQKSTNQKSSGSTTGNAGANKDGPSHKNCDENTSRSQPSTNSEEGAAGKSAINEGSELLKFGSMLAASITDLKATMAGKFDQLEEILTRPDIWAQDTEERDDTSADDADNDSSCTGDADNDSSRSTAEEPPSKKSKLSSSGEMSSKQTVLNSIAEKGDPGIDEQLAKMINQLMFKKKKPDEEKLTLKGKLPDLTKSPDSN